MNSARRIGARAGALNCSPGARSCTGAPSAAEGANEDVAEADTRSTVHEQVFTWIGAQVADLPAPTAVLEVGSLDINGGIRPLFAGADHYHGLDIAAGPGVDEVADAASWIPPRTYDVVVCAEVLEHAPAWADILATMWAATTPGGTVLMTCATEPRAPHSAIDGLDVREDEHYANVGAGEVRALVATWPDARWSLEWAQDRGDLYLRVDKAASTATA